MKESVVRDEKRGIFNLLKVAVGAVVVAIVLWIRNSFNLLS